MRLLYLQMIHHPDHIICQSLKTVQSGWPVCLPDPSAIEGYDPVVFSEGTHLTEPRPVICTHASYQNQRFSGAMDLIEYVNAVLLLLAFTLLPERFIGGLVGLSTG